MIVANGSTNVTTYFCLRDSTTHAPKTSVTITDIDVYYVEQGAAISAKADLTAHSAANDAHADNYGFEIGQGLYRIDWPDAAFDGGVGKHVILVVVCSGVDTTFLDVELSPAVNTVAVGGTTQTGRDLGASVLLSSGTGTGQISLSSGIVSADMVQISGDSTAADTLELQFDGTGITGATYPATQAQAGSIAVASAAINTVATGATITQGVETNTYASTHALDGTAHSINDSASGIDVVYRFSVGPDGVPVTCKAIVALTGTGDTVLVKAYNWLTTSYDTVGSITGTAGVTYQTKTFDLITSHVGTGANVGLVDIQFYAATDQTAVLYLDQLLVSYAQAATGIANGSTVTLGAATTNTNLIGQNWSLALGGQDISGSYIRGAKSVTGIASGTTDVTFEDCDFGAATVPPGRYVNCGFGVASGTLTAASAGQYLLRNCYSRVPGSGTPVFDWATSSGTVGVNGRGWHGGSSHTIDGDVTISWEVAAGGGQTFDGGGSVELRGTMRAATFTNCATGKTSQIVGVCGPIGVNGSGGTVNIYGIHGVVTDSSSAAVTINDLGATTSTLADTGDAMTLASGAITAAVIATGAVDADALATDAVTEIADGVLARDIGSGSNAVTSEERTVRSALRFLRNKWSIATGTLTVTCEDDSTPAWTSAVTGTTGADPVTASDPT